MEPEDEDLLWSSIKEALGPISHLESELPVPRLEKRVRDYFRKAAKALEFSTGTWSALINDYADSAFSSLFQGLGDRAWLAKVDFILVLDAGVRETFPARFLNHVPRQELERDMLQAHDRAFDEQRCLLMLWEEAQVCVPASQGPKARKKVVDATAHGRKVAVQLVTQPTDPAQVKVFMRGWIDATVDHLGKHTQGEPSAALPKLAASRLFHRLLERGALPTSLVSEHGPPPKQWHFVDFLLYRTYLARDEATALEAKRRRTASRARTRGCGLMDQDATLQTKCEAKEESVVKLEDGCGDGGGQFDGAVVAPLVTSPFGSLTPRPPVRPPPFELGARGSVGRAADHRAAGPAMSLGKGGGKTAGGATTRATQA